MKVYLTLLFITIQWYLHAQNVVINEIYGGGGISGAVFTNDFVELYNNSNTPIALNGYSIQYASASGSSWSALALTGTIYPQGYYLIQLASSGTTGQPLPAPDAVGSINMNSSTGGKVALVNLTSAMPSSTCPTGPVIIDLVGYGSAGCFWGSASAPSPSAVHSIERQQPGQNTMQNGADFKTKGPTPHGASRLTQTISFDPPPSLQYGHADLELLASSSSGLPLTFSSSNPAIASVSGYTLSIHGAGQVTITASQAGDTNYQPAPDLPLTINIGKAPLNAKADDRSIAGGDPLPLFTITYDGFVGDDHKGVIDVPPVVECLATSTSPPGNYPITLTPATDDNYLITTSPGQLTILDPGVLPDVYALSPADGATGIGLTIKVTAKPVKGAGNYSIQVSPSADFSSGVITMTGKNTQTFTALTFGTKYYVRAATNLSPIFGKRTSFTTGPPEQFTFVSSPANGATRVGVNPTITSTLIGGAGIYTIEISTTPDFSSAIFTKSGNRAQSFSGLQLSTLYYTRVKTDLSSNWGPVKSFTTGDAVSLSYVTSPPNNASHISWLPVITVNSINAGSYSLQVSPQPDFSSDVTELTSATNRFTLSGMLAYNTKYYTRVRSNFTTTWGAPRSFTTGDPASFSYVVTPANGLANQNFGLSVASNLVPAAAEYTIELNPDSAFSTATAVRKSATGRVIHFDLSPDTKYYSRVKTNLAEDWGITRSFTTGNSNSLSFIVSPPQGATNVNLVTNVIASTIPGISAYTIELNTEADFSGPALVKANTKPSMSFTLDPGQTYYARVKNSASGEWGQVVKSFATGTPQSLAYVVSPRNGGVDVPANVKVYANAVGGASAFTIELNSMEDFSGPGQTQTSPSRIMMFEGLASGTKYYTRVQTNLAPGLWGKTTSFSTASVSSAGRLRTSWQGDTAEEEAKVNAIGPILSATLTVYPNPFPYFFTLLVNGAPGIPFNVIITDRTGEIMNTGTIYGGIATTWGDGWPGGLYFVKVWNGFYVMTQRILKSGSTGGPDTRN